MAQKNIKSKERKFGTQTSQKTPLINPRYKNLIYTTTFIVVILILFIVNNSQSEPEEGPYPPNYESSTMLADHPMIGKTAPNFELEGTSGKKVRLSALKGKIVILDFWATWCPPCRKGIPDLIDIQKQYKSKGVEVVGVSVDTDTKKDVPAFIKNNGINYTIAYFNEKVTNDYGGIRSIPTAFVIDQKGKIVDVHVGLQDKQTYITQIEKLLKK